MENFFIIIMVLVCFGVSFLIKFVEKFHYNKGREDMLNQLYNNGFLSNEHYSKSRSTLK
jgi:hypothetical protein